MDELFGRIRSEEAAMSPEDHCDGTIFKMLFLKKSPLLTEEVFPVLRERLKQPDFQRRFIDQHKKSLELERQRLCAEVQKCEAAGHDSRFYTMQLPPLERRLAINSLEAYLELMCDPAEGHLGIVELLASDYMHLNNGADGMRYITEHYPLYRVGSFLYERYVAKTSIFERFERPCASALSALYREHGIDLDTADQQFNKYGLLSLCDDISIINSKESQSLVDARIGRHFRIDIPRDLLAAIEAAIANGWVTNISFDIGAITEVTPAFEAVEYGSVFNFQALQLPSVSKLYDEECYEDALWIKVDTHLPASMTFEELCADFPTLDGAVVTQVVHLEFFVAQGQQFISHLDHEYILYTEEAYSRRRYDASIKGHKKHKTFKIDKAHIPLDFNFEHRYFIYLVLDAYFKNKRLISEYFVKLSRQ